MGNQIKKITLETALRRTLGFSKGSPERAVRNMMELAGLFSHAQPSEDEKKTCAAALYGLIKKGDSAEAIAYVEEVYGFSSASFT